MSKQGQYIDILMNELVIKYIPTLLPVQCSLSYYFRFCQLQHVPCSTSVCCEAYTLLLCDKRTRCQRAFRNVVPVPLDMVSICR